MKTQDETNRGQEVSASFGKFWNAPFKKGWVCVINGRVLRQENGRGPGVPRCFKTREAALAAGERLTAAT